MAFVSVTALSMSFFVVVLFAKNPQFCEAADRYDEYHRTISVYELLSVNICMVVLWCLVAFVSVTQFFISLFTIGCENDRQLAMLREDHKLIYPLLATGSVIISACVDFFLMLPLGLILLTGTYCPHPIWWPYLWVVLLSFLILTPVGVVIMGTVICVLLAPTYVLYFAYKRFSTKEEYTLVSE